MEKGTFAAKTVNEYISAFPATVRSTLEKIRQTIRTAAPEAEEVISYQMPAYKYNGMLVFFAGYNNHIGFYPTPEGIEAFKKELSAYKGAKGSVQFPLDKPIPFDLINKIVKHRVKQNEDKGAAKKTTAPAVKKSKPAKPSDAEQVTAYMKNLKHPLKPETEAIRAIIKNSNKKLSERIKWNAPSYYYKEDIVTFGPYKNGKVLLVFHHPAIVRIKSALLEGDYKDRRLAYFGNMNAIKENKKELERIMNELVKAIDKKPLI